MAAYEQLVQRIKRISDVNEAAGLLHWDLETYMPAGGAEARSSQLGTLSALSHELFTAPEVGRLLAEAEKAESDERHVALLRETRFAFDRATKVPSDLVESISKTSTRALGIWTQARAKSDFAHFRPVLAELIELKRKYAAAIDDSQPAYEVLFQDYEPWISLSDTRANLAALRDGLKPLLARAEKAEAPADVFAGKWDVEAQVALNKRVLEKLGYDFNHGRLDVSAHPFSTGNAYDARITTRYDAEDPLSSQSSTIHEFGHALYTQGLPREDYGTPLGDARDLVVHESQSRLWENHVGRSQAYWDFALPLWREAFPGRLDKVTPEGAWRASNVVKPSLIRVEADELTYHMHIALRFEVEEGIMSGRIGVDEIPAAWNERMKKYLGVAPPDDARGCLQDVHWSHGAFGYFPTYSLGSMLSAQIFAEFERATGPADARIRAADFAPLKAWLRENVHMHGRRYKTGELIERATGAALTPKAFLSYAESKFSKLWQ